jgi:hypothetical protein
MMDSFIADLLKVEPMHGGSVNGWIQIPPSFVIVMYFVIVIITMVSTAYYLRRKIPLVEALRKAISLAFFCAGFLYLVHSERTWYSWFSEDVPTYSGSSTGEKIRIFLGPLYDFVAVASTVLNDSDYTLYASDTATGLMAQYYLLPRRHRASEKIIIVLYNDNTAYDELTRTFHRGDERIENAELLFRYDPGAYIVRVR